MILPILADFHCVTFHPLLVYLFVFKDAVFEQHLLFLIAKNFKTSSRKVMFHAGTTEMIKKTHSIHVISFTNSIHVISFTHSILFTSTIYAVYVMWLFINARALITRKNNVS